MSTFRRFTYTGRTAFSRTISQWSFFKPNENERVPGKGVARKLLAVTDSTWLPLLLVGISSRLPTMVDGNALLVAENIEEVAGPVVSSRVAVLAAAARQERGWRRRSAKWRTFRGVGQREGPEP